MFQARHFAAVAVLAAAVGTPAHASGRLEVRHEAPVPCSVLCPGTADPTVAGELCGTPAVAGSYDQTLFRFTSADGAAIVEAFPHYDYDIVACTAERPSQVIDLSLTGWCTGFAGPYRLGCSEQVRVDKARVLEMTQGRTSDFLIRSFNWLDAAPLDLYISGPVEITDDSFQAGL